MVAPAMAYEFIENLTDGMSVRGRNRVLKAGNGAAAIHWRDRYLMRHFRSGAATRYRYSRRKRSTVRNKRRLAARGVVQQGGRQALVHTGNLKRAVRRLHPVRATARRATIRIHGPSYLNIRPKAGRPNIGEEVLRVAPIEIREINQVSARAADAEFQRSRTRKRRVA